MELSYRFEPLSFGTLSARVGVNYSDEFYTVADSPADFVVSEMTLIDASVTLADIDLNGGRGRLKASLWGRNLTDEDQELGNGLIPVSPGLTGANTVVYGLPRTYGLSLNYEFR